MLNLIYNGALAELREESPGIRFSKIPLVGRFQVGICKIGKGCTTERRLSGLPRPGHRHKGVLAKQCGQTGHDLATNHGRHAINQMRNLQVLLANCAFRSSNLNLLLDPLSHGWLAPEQHAGLVAGNVRVADEITP